MKLNSSYLMEHRINLFNLHIASQLEREAFSETSKLFSVSEIVSPTVALTTRPPTTDSRADELKGLFTHGTFSSSQRMSLSRNSQRESDSSRVPEFKLTNEKIVAATR